MLVPLKYNTSTVLRVGGNPLARPHASTLPHTLAPSRPCRGLYWPCHSIMLRASPAVSRPCRAPRLASPALCHDTVPCIMTQHRQIGSSPSSLLHTLFFFFSHIIFFHFVPPTRDHNFFFFHFPVEQNKFIKIYFIYFFPVLHIVKP